MNVMPDGKDEMISSMMLQDLLVLRGFVIDLWRGLAALFPMNASFKSKAPTEAFCVCVCVAWGLL